MRVLLSTILVSCALMFSSAFAAEANTTAPQGCEACKCGANCKCTPENNCGCGGKCNKKNAKGQGQAKGKKADGNGTKGCYSCKDKNTTK